MQVRELLLALATVAAVVPAGNAVAQAGAIKVTGTELQAWFASDQMAVAGISLSNGCHWITKGPGQARSQTIYCPNAAPFTITGEARVEGDRLCSKFTYPDGTKFEGCQEVYRVGDNRYEARVDGVARNVFYRLTR
jgi:hypothetical protein